MSKLVPFEKENAFIGAEVKYKSETFYVVKINEKSVYITSDKNFLDLWTNREKGITWKNFCIYRQAIMVKYDTVLISEIELSRGRDFIIPANKNKSKRYLKPYMEVVVKTLFQRFVKKKGSWQHPIETSSGKKMYILKFNLNGQALIRFEMDYFFYDFELDVYTFYKKLGQSRETKVITWPREKELPKEMNKGNELKKRVRKRVIINKVARLG